MLHYRIHDFDLKFESRFQSYVFLLEHWESSNENASFPSYLKDSFSLFGLPLTTSLIVYFQASF